MPTEEVYNSKIVITTDGLGSHTIQNLRTDIENSKAFEIAEAVATLLDFDNANSEEYSVNRQIYSRITK